MYVPAPAPQNQNFSEPPMYSLFLPAPNAREYPNISQQMEMSEAIAIVWTAVLRTLLKPERPAEGTNTSSQSVSTNTHSRVREHIAGERSAIAWERIDERESVLWLSIEHGMGRKSGQTLDTPTCLLRNMLWPKTKKAKIAPTHGRREYISARADLLCHT